MSDWYKLIDRKVVPFDNNIRSNPLGFCAESEAAFLLQNRKIANDYLPDCDGEVVRISTIFLVLDHGYGDGPPLVFETMVFGGRYDCEQRRYTTIEGAEIGHQMVIEFIQAAPVEAQEEG